MPNHSYSPSRAPFSSRAASNYLKAAFQSELAARPDVYKPAQGAFSGQWGAAPKGGLLADSKTDFLSALSVAYVTAGGSPPQGATGKGLTK